MVGRTYELAFLDAALRDTPTALLVGGEAGVGKTRLIREFLDTARRKTPGLRVLIGGCLQISSEGLPFAPFSAVLRQLVREMGVDGRHGAAARRQPGRAWPGCCRSSASPTPRRPPPRRVRGCSTTSCCCSSG